MFLSYSAWKLYDACPRAYLFRYVTKPPTVEPDNKVNSLFGTIVGGLFETFFNEKIWQSSDPTAALLARAESAVEAALQRELDGARKIGEGMKIPATDLDAWVRKAIVWSAGEPNDQRANYASREELLADVLEAIPRGVEIIRHHRLLGVKALAEVNLDAKIADHIIIGRADFVIRRASPEDDLIILDGKGSKWGDKYVDDTQLRWYAMLWRERSKTKRLPDGIGFILWRMEPEAALMWITLSEGEVNGLREHVIEAAESIETGRVRLSLAPPDQKLAIANDKFAPHPGPLNCTLCAYLSICPSGQAVIQGEADRKAAEKAAKALARRGVETPGAPAGPGVEDVGL